VLHFLNYSSGFRASVVSWRSMDIRLSTGDCGAKNGQKIRTAFYKIVALRLAATARPTTTPRKSFKTGGEIVQSRHRLFMICINPICPTVLFKWSARNPANARSAPA
jgi:hypothetical protein